MANLSGDDVLLDTAGPFQDRSTTLIEAAIDIGCDVIDIADCLRYVRNVISLRKRIDASGIHVFTACSSVSAISAAMIRLSEIANPIRVIGFLLPATRNTAAMGTAKSLFQSVGQPIDVFENGRVESRQGWQASRSWNLRGWKSCRKGYLFETADTATLPEVFPSLRTVYFFVDTNVHGLNAVFCGASRFSLLRRLVAKGIDFGVPLARLLGSRRSALAYEIEGSSGEIVRLELTSTEHGQIIPIAPAVLAARALARDAVLETGLIPPNQQVDPNDLVKYLEAHSIQLHSETNSRK